MSPSRMLPYWFEDTKSESPTMFAFIGRSCLLINVRHPIRDQKEIVIFEAFEASPLSEKVLATQNALQWDFPGSAVAIPHAEFVQASFQENLASFLERASTESIKRFAAQSSKAGSFAFESRGTADPALITQMLMTLLEVSGHSIQPPIIRKRVRDEVYWTDGAENPWRRCPYWLIIRVALRRFLTVLHGGQAGRAHYKFLLCVLLRNLIEEAVGLVEPEIVSFLQAKLARRLGKLEDERDRAPPTVRSVYDASFGALQDLFSKTLAKANERLRAAWNEFKRGIQRHIPILPRHVLPSHTRLSLPNSEGYLRKVLSWQTYMDSESQTPTFPWLSSQFDISSATTGPFKIFADRYFALSELEMVNANRNGPIPVSVAEQQSLCLELADRIDEYIRAVDDAYQSNAEGTSVMLLTVMELWMVMDSLACAMFPLLFEYSPGFLPQIVNVLQLLPFADMRRLQVIEQYLQDRHTKSDHAHKTIYDDPTRGCFAERYFDESADSSRLHKLQQVIEEAAKSARTRKEDQWRSLSAEFEQLQRTILQSRCTFVARDNHRSQHDENCQKCYLENKRDRMSIQVHEHPLPADPIQAKAVVFELRCPKAFIAYRDATWRILGALARAKQGQSFQPRVKLFEYSELKAFMEPSAQGICLASSTKSWLKTHYRGVSLPVDLDQVCFQNGLKLGYFDAVTGIWPGRDTYRATFAHHCPIQIPLASPLSVLQSLPEFASDSDGPSSYEVLASQTRCPSELNEHEFTAFQAMFSGKHRRWMTILLELGSSNLNFGTEATSLLISQLAIQAGPSSGDDTLRAIHTCFRDRHFCKRLGEQIDVRLEGISSNWRETYCMDMLLTLILRLCSIASGNSLADPRCLLEKARATTLQWTRQLRSEIQTSATAESSRRYSQYAFRSALLCRRSFALYAADANNGRDVPTIEKAALECFIECSITFQDNMPSEPATLPLFYKNMLIRDLKMVYHMRFAIRRSVQAEPTIFYQAIDKVWPQANDSTPRRFHGLSLVKPTSEFWMTSTICSTLQTNSQIIHYNMLEGHLFVDGKPLGKLPAEHRKALILGQLFGNQSLLTYPSPLRGMTYTLAFAINGHQIHIGFRQGTLIVRACVSGTVLELIPQTVFGGARNFDVPDSLVEHCVHWLDLNSGMLEIRQQPDIWIAKSSNWILDFTSRLARRRRNLLIDPHSPPFRQIARIFDRFEYRGRLTVFQPENGNLSVELRRLELSFFINGKGLLECRQLWSEIDPNQDAGTWYGLNSKLVLRDMVNHKQRSIIVPMGSVKHGRDRFHVAVDVENDGTYGRFFINDILGRLDCPPEPRLLYLKAHFHACTSFVIPDPLTGQTGGEEALHCLRSGYCQPWTPLNLRPLQTLLAIAKITPRRQYYPRDVKRMQQVSWDTSLTVTIQQDDFRSVVEGICEQSQTLISFAATKTSQTPIEFEDHSSHLGYRSTLRRRLYHRPSAGSNDDQASLDSEYIPRGVRTDSQRRQNVFESVSLVRTWPTSMRTTTDLAGILQNWPSIGGLDHDYDPVLLSDLLNMQPALEWGSMVSLCRNSGHKDMYQLMFLFAAISYGGQVDMDTVRVWIAFAIIEDLKSIQLPDWSTYTDFKYNHLPAADHFRQLVDGCRTPYPGDVRDHFQVHISHKMLKKLQNEQHKHEQQTEKYCKTFVESLLQQWPCPKPSHVASGETPLFDELEAISIISPEWLRLYQNLDLSSFVEKVQRVLDGHQASCRTEVPKLTSLRQELLPTRPTDSRTLETLHDLLSKPGANMLMQPSTPSCTDPAAFTVKPKTNFMSPLHRKENIPFTSKPSVVSKSEALEASPEIKELDAILESTMDSPSVVRQRYGADLRFSLNALKSLQKTTEKQNPLEFSWDIDTAINKARETVNQKFAAIRAAIGAGDARRRWLQGGFLWPCIAPITLLEQLRSTSNSLFDSKVEKSLIDYAISLTYLQRLLRMDDARRRGHLQRLHDEQKNIGHENWDPFEYPDWLLLEIDANILIRKDQVEVAFATILPTSKTNSVLQMNMGQG